jgi:hypothetical protein
MERREVERHVGTEPLDDPARLGVDLPVRVVAARDQEGRDLDPDVRLVHEVLERL